MLHIALYQPDIPQNVGAAIRLCACMGVGLDIIQPCGFPWDERKIRQSALDYMDALTLNRHESWEAFQEHYHDRRIVLMTTKSSEPYTEFSFRDDDILLAGRESAGAPEKIHESVHARLAIPMRGGLRSLNIVNAASMILGEALRQTNGFTAGTGHA